MSKRLNITDEIYGRLLALVTDWYKTKQTGETYWFCQCECNNIVSVCLYNLKSGATRSCGCLHKELLSKINKSNRLNITDQIYNRLQAIVTDWYKTKETGITHWWCLCECGDIVSVQLENLRNGSTKSCGCLNKEIHSGENSNFWKGGVTSLQDSIRTSKEYKEFVQKILKKANYTCQLSKEIGGILNVHHIKGFAKILEENNITTEEEAFKCQELWDEKNVIVLSEKWHSGVKVDNPNAFHRLYGTRSFTEQDFYTWFNKFKIDF